MSEYIYIIYDIFQDNPFGIIFKETTNRKVVRIYPKNIEIDIVFI